MSGAENQTIQNSQKVEQEIGLNPQKVFDQVKNELEESEFKNTENKAAVNYENGNKILKSQELPLEPNILAHETVHAEMLNEKGELNLYGNNLMDWRLYGEFTANFAENSIDDIKISGQEKMIYFSAKNAYENIREKAIEQGLPKKNSLYDEFTNAEQINNPQLEKRFINSVKRYQDAREQTLTAQCAKLYQEENPETNLEEIIDPTKEKYEEIINYIHQKEDEVLDKWMNRN